MITKFSIFEAQQRQYSGGNVFSNNHRSPNLPSYCTMTDIDTMEVSNTDITAIIEEKGVFGSKFLGNPMSAGGTWQRSKLLDICNALNCPLIFLETTSGDVYEFSGSSFSKKVNKSINPLDTSDRIYVEFRYGKPAAVMVRTEGVKIQDLPQDNIFNAAYILSNQLGIKLYLVNDVIDNKIYIREYNQTTTHLITPIDSQESWESAYRSIGLF